jgi:hypothetical protein
MHDRPFIAVSALCEDDKVHDVLIAINTIIYVRPQDDGDGSLICVRIGSDHQSIRVRETVDELSRYLRFEDARTKRPAETKEPTCSPSST